MSLLLLIVSGIFGLTTAFIVCELGQGINSAFDGIDSAISLLHWYLFPIEIQRMLPMIMAHTQRPVLLECLGSTKCTRDVFKDVRIDLINLKFGWLLRIIF